MQFVYLPVIQKDLAELTVLWNSHNIRKQNQGDILSGIPDVLYHYPEVYGKNDLHIVGKTIVTVLAVFLSQELKLNVTFLLHDHFQTQTLNLLLKLTEFKKGKYCLYIWWSDAEHCLYNNLTTLIRYFFVT